MAIFRVRKVITTFWLTDIHTAAQQARLDQMIHQSCGQGWPLLPFLMPRFSRTDHEKVELTSMMVLNSVNLLEIQFENSMNKLELEAWKAFILVKNTTGRRGPRTT